MRSSLVGYTGFVGSNLKQSVQFNELYNSKNIEDAYDTEPELLVYAGLPSAMFKANTNPEMDYADIKQAIDNIKAIKPKQIVFLSSVAVYDITHDVDENHAIDERQLLPYGKNRLFLEKWISGNCDNYLIIRLPALYGINLKKNFIYDYINVIPAMLNEIKYRELLEENKLIASAFKKECDNYYHFVATGEEKRQLYDFFTKASFNALHFTDSRSKYQFYNLNRLWADIMIALNNGINLLNIVTEPVSVAEVYKVLSDRNYINELSKEPYNYDIKSIHAELFGGERGYFIDKKEVLNDLKKYVNEEKRRIWG